MKASTKNISIYADLEIENIDYILETLENSLIEYLKFFKIDKFSKIEINIYKNQDEYEENMYQLGFEENVAFDPINKNIYFVYDKSKILVYLKQQLVHMIFYEVYKDKYGNKDWLENGLAKYLSSKKLNDNEFRNWFIAKMALKDTSEYSKENIKDIGYLLVKYINDYYGKSYLENIIQNKEELEKLEQTIFNSALGYYNKLFKIDKIKNNIADIKTIDELIDYINLNYTYGWYDKNEVNHKEKQTEEYYTRSVDEIIRTKEATSFERAILASSILTNLKIENKVVVDIDKMIAYPLIKQLDWKQLNWKLGLVDYERKENLIEIDTIPVNLSFEELKEYIKNHKYYKQK